MKKYVIGIDSGTSVVKAGLYDMEGNEILVRTCSTPVIEKHFGWEEFDMDTDWDRTSSALKNLMNGIYDQGIRKEEIAAVGVGGKGQGICLLDHSMRPVREAILWNDARSVPKLNEWMQPGGISEKIHDINGNWIMPGNMACILPWLKENEKESLDKAYTISMPTSWLAYKLTGEHKLVRTDVFSMIDGKTRYYSEKIFEILGLTEYRHLFADPIDTWDITGYVRKDIEESINVPAGIPVVNMGWDVICALTGVGALEAGEANIIMGTSGVIELVMPECPNKPDRLGCVSVCSVPGKWVQLIAPATGMPNQDWFINNFAYEDKEIALRKGCNLYDYYEKEVIKVPIGSNGVIYSPYLSANGEVAPFTDTTARAGFTGLHPQVSRPAILRAIYEGVAFSFRHCLEAYTYPVRSIRLSGGGSKNEVWCQIVADVCNRQISKVSGTEFGIKGVAWNAAWVAGIFKTQEEACRAFTKVDKVYTPNPEAVEQYNELFEIYKSIPEAMSGIWHRRMDFIKKYGYDG